MIVGDPSVFAIESGITQAYERLSFLAFGFFTIHVGGYRYGVCEPDATMLSCSFGEVEQRIFERGKHVAPFSCEPDAGKIADAFRGDIYTDENKKNYFGMAPSEFCDFFSQYKSNLMWAPDGDEAFDDGSYILQFDIKDRVRVIAFKSCKNHLYDSATLRDVWCEADEFYRILQQWHETFKSERASMLKMV